MDETSQERLDQLFDNYCTDGVVTRDSFKTILQVLNNNPTEEAVDTVFEHFDTDSIPGLSKDEYNEWISKCLVSQDQTRNEIVEALNVLFSKSENPDAGYPIDDLLEILKSKGNEQLNDEEAEEFRQELQTIDLSGDGTITAQELSTFFNPGEIQVDDLPEAQTEQEDPAPEEQEGEPTETQEETTEEVTEETTETQEEEKQEETTEEAHEEAQEETQEETQEQTQEQTEPTEETQEQTETTEETQEQTETTEETQEQTETTEETQEQTETTEEKQEGEQTENSEEKQEGE